MTKEETFYVISWITQEFLSEDFYKTEDVKYVLKNVRVYRRDISKLNGYKHAHETQDIFEAQRYKTELNARTALDRMSKYVYNSDMSKCVYNSDYKIHCVKIKTEVTSINEIGEI